MQKMSGGVTLKKSKYEIDMCNGSIMDKLISFSLPLMLSSILQLMFNAVDIIVVGRFSGSQALAAVGSTTALINIFTNLFIGISLGANVLAARYFAAGREKEMSEAVHTAVALALVSGIVMAFVGVGASRLALQLMDTPPDVIDLSTVYMRIYFMGMPFFMLYNYGAAILRAVGDCGAGPAFSHCHSYGRSRSGDRDGDVSVYLLYPGSLMPVSIRRKLSAPLLKTCHPLGLSEEDIPGGDPGGDPEHGDQFLQRAAAVVSQFLRLDRHGGIYRRQQHPRLSVCSGECRDPGVHELYEPELQRGETEAYGQGAH